MSRELKIWINGQPVDVLQGANQISFVYSIEGTEPGKVGGAYAKRSITLPGTKANHELFQNIDQSGIVVTTANQLLPARAEVGGIPILTGKAQLNRAALIGNRHGLKASNYQVTFVGSNADWFGDMGGLLIRALDWGTVELTAANYDAAGNADPLTEDTCFALIKWKQWERETDVLYTELTPCLFLSAILRRAFQSIGYRLNSAFDNDPFNRLIVPVPLSLDGEYAANFVNVRASRASFDLTSIPELTSGDLIMNDDSTAPNADPGNNFNTTTGEYTAPIGALYAINLQFVTPITWGPTGFNIFFYVNGSPVTGPTYSSITPVSTIEWIGEMEAGDVFTIEITRIDSAVTLTDFELVIEAEKERWRLGETLDFDYIIPGTWYVKDFITDITQIFNLRWETDVLSRTVTTYPRDTHTLSYRSGGNGSATTTTREGFYLPPLFETDITRKVDLSEGGEMQLQDDKKQDYVLAWGTGDPTAEEIEKRAATSLYSARYRHTTGRYPAGSEWTYTTYLAKTVHINDTEISSGGNMAAQVPLLYGKNYFEEPDAEADYTLNPRLLYFAGRRSGDDGYIRIYNEMSSATSAYDFPAAWQVNYNDSSGVDWSLSFADEMTNYGQTVRGLFKSLHLQTLRRIEEGRRFLLNIRFDPLDISALSFRNALRWDGSRLLLERVDGYAPAADRSTRTELLLDVIPTTADAAKVSGPVLLEGATQNSLTSLGAINGVIGAPGTGGGVVVYRYRELIEGSTSRFITLPGTSGILSVPDPYIAVTVNMNSTILVPVLQYTISGALITIDELVHFDGCNYFITLHEVV